MEHSGLQGGMYSTMGSGMLGLEMSLNHHPHPQPQPQPQQNPHPQMVSYAHHEVNPHTQSQHSIKPNYPFPPKSKPQQLTISDEDEPGINTEEGNGDGKRKVNNSSPWQRMKWTDSMVKLLIMVVYFIGDEAGSEGTDPVGKKKGSGGVLQKKGKWKSVSRAMLERGFCVSPQQCEDKFNDLNKRYKRVNDLLGKGTACKVVENQSLLDTMDHLTPKKKEEVKKLLNSKHLFFREMCAYHTSCAGGGSGGGGSGSVVSGGHHSPEVVVEPSSVQQHHCLHSSENATIEAYSDRKVIGGSKMAEGGSKDEEEDDNEYDEDDEDEDEDEEYGHDEEDNGNDERSSKKRPRKVVFDSSSSPLIQQLSGELASMVQDTTTGSSEKRQWMKNRMVQLEEQKVNFQLEAFELEKQRLKWLKFSSKKERDMEREKLQSERMRLENDRMLLLLQQKELELLDLQQQQTQQLSSN